MTLVRDLRYGLRILVRNPTFGAAAIAVVALGIGATTAVFSVVRGVLLTPLPYREPDRLVLFRADGPGFAREALVTGEELAAIRARTDLFESVAVINESPSSLTSPGDMEAVTGASASDNFLETLGIKPFLGRTVTGRDIGPQWVSAVDISYDLWQRHWHGDPTILGKQIEVNNISMTVVGITPPAFRLYLGPAVKVTTRIDVWYPRGAGYDEARVRSQLAIARLRDGVALGHARAQVADLMAALIASRPGSYPTGSVRLSLSTLDEDVVSDVKPALFALTGAVVFVLLVACANLANLLLARASARTRELALRVSVGASRGQIVRQLLAEGLVVGVLGAIGGLLLAQWCVDGLLLLAPPALPRREAIAVDGGVAAFAIVMSLISTLLVSLVPAWHATKSDLAAMLKNDPALARGAATTRGLLVAGQLALSLVLLVGAGLMTRAFVSLRSVPLGFDPRQAMTMNVELQVQRFNMGSIEESWLKRLAFYHALSQSVQQIPGVERTGIGLFVPLTGGPITERFSRGPNQPESPAYGAIALAGFLESLRVPLVAGRYFTIEDDKRLVIIVDRQLADEMWPRESALGKRLLLVSALRQQWVEVVGVVAHVQMDGVRSRGLPEIFMTYAARQYSDLSLVVRAPNALSLVPAIEAAVQRLGPGRPVHDIRALEDYVADASADTRFALFVLGAFASLALALTAIGVYGIVAYATARRTREIAVRLALGADGSRIVALVVRDGLMWTALGLAGGVAGALALSRYLSSLLFKVGERDPITFVAVALLLAAIALVATLIPALRAVRIAPMLALRSE